ncbi:MAG: response regulator transcription factor [Anaerolinea sp.]|nr:response regulator transcription factor [Anaerolinea sp.]
MEPLRVLIVADDPLARAGLALLVENIPDCVVVDQVNSAEVTITSPAPDAIIWDVGWEAAPILPDWNEFDLPVVALLSDAEDAPAVWSCGVQALLPRELGSRRLFAAVQAVVQAFIVVDPAFSAALLPIAGVTETAVPITDLTPRETEVLQFLAAGLTNKAIAQQLDISDHTVKFHVNAIMSKLGAPSRTAAVVHATRLGLIRL